MAAIRFKFSAPKAHAAIHWMVRERPGIDLHAALKAFYFADKKHLNENRRPIFGATYRALKWGPVPQEVYDMMKGEALWLAELKTDRYPWRLEGYHLHIQNNAAPDLSVFSESDLEALRYGLSKSLGMTFSERTEATHGPDWQAARLGTMRYEDMIDESPDKAELVAYLRETARYIRL